MFAKDVKSSAKPHNNEEKKIKKEKKIRTEVCYKMYRAKGSIKGFTLCIVCILL